VAETSVISFSAAGLCAVVAASAVIRNWRSVAAWSFCAGMALFGLQSACNGFSIRSTSVEDVTRWQTLAFISKALVPGIWGFFSLIYSRGNYREFLSKWRIVLASALLLPVALMIGFQGELFEVVHRKGSDTALWLEFASAGRALNGLLLLASVFILMNLETTLRSSVGTARWRIKFVVLGLGVIFGTRIYTRSQAFLFVGQDLALVDIEDASLLIGCVMIGIGYARSGLREIDVYPSSTVLASSVTVLLAGAYLLLVGVAAQILARLGWAENFQTQAILVLGGIATLAVLLFSDRLRQRVRRFISRHFARPQHDSRKIWALATRQMASVLDPVGLCVSAVKLISETFQALSVWIWVVDDRKHELVLAASTGGKSRNGPQASPLLESETVRSALASQPGPFALERARDERLKVLGALGSAEFAVNGSRICVPLFVGERWLGVALLADRVNGVSYTAEELDLLKCIGDQLAVALLNLRLTDDLMQSKELQAFQTMSTFFVHDLKNAASSLNLMLRNLPVHFDDPEFRADALRGLGNTVARIDGMIERLTTLRKKIEPRCEVSDLNRLVSETIEQLDGLRDVELKKELQPLPAVMVDREQIASVVTNLLLNARDALGAGGRIEVQTAGEDGRAVLIVSDNGKGMSGDFLKNSLFRPFQSTKKKGLGIGMFQSKTIIEAHRGSIQVQSETGKGTTFRIYLPTNTTAS
jgi:putative PEP-CTERM system histidine kinase